jgi:predicted O-linked N-acetylglucosamine transferase (SPINDLY family)
MAGLFDHHDHERFDWYAFSIGPKVEQDPYRIRMKRAFRHWFDLNDLSDQAAASVIARQRIDVLVDLSGTTHGSRAGILQYRPAPFVAHYLGFPGTLANPGIDFLIADETVAPVEHDPFYAERVVRLPGCYQVNDDQREHPAVWSRNEAGLPEDAIVISNFNRASKWTEEFVTIWLSAVARAPASLLWLVDPGPRARSAVMAIAARYNVAHRVVWAARLPMTSHLARIGAADLALDQLPYASHATGANTLWMGVPLLTCLGQSFPGRVGASLVRAVGLDDFVTVDVDAYRLRLDQLLADPKRLVEAAQHLRTRQNSLALFDTAAFASRWEQMLVRLVDTHRIHLS